MLIHLQVFVVVIPKCYFTQINDFKESEKFVLKWKILDFSFATVIFHIRIATSA